MAMGKYGHRSVLVLPAECSQQLGRAPSKRQSSESLVLRVVSQDGTLCDSSLPVSLTLSDAPHPYFPPTCRLVLKVL